MIKKMEVKIRNPYEKRMIKKTKVKKVYMKCIKHIRKKCVKRKKEEEKEEEQEDLRSDTDRQRSQEEEKKNS